MEIGGALGSTWFDYDHPSVHAPWVTLFQEVKVSGVYGISWFRNNGCKNFETECKCFHILRLTSRFYQSACVASRKAAFSDFSQCGREVSVGHIAILQGKPSKLYPCHYKTSFVLTRVTCRLLAQRSDKSQFAGRKRRKRTLIAWTFSDYDNRELW